MPLDAEIAKILPRMPLRDVPTMTPQSARDSLLAMAQARNDQPLPDPGRVEAATLPGPAGAIPVRVTIHPV